MLEKRYRSDDHHEIQRFPRRGVSDNFADLLSIPTIRDVKSEESRWLVEELILERSINLLTAPPSGFKTWLSLALGGAVSQGIEFHSRKTVKTRVLYLDRENPPSVIHKRRKDSAFEKRLFPRVGDIGGNIFPPSIDDPRLIQIAELHHPLIIFDFLRSIPLSG